MMLVTSWINITKATLCVEEHAVEGCMYTRTAQKGTCEDEPKTRAAHTVSDSALLSLHQVLRMPGDVTYQNKIQVCIFNCGTGNSF